MKRQCNQHYEPVDVTFVVYANFTYLFFPKYVYQYRTEIMLSKSYIVHVYIISYIYEIYHMLKTFQLDQKQKNIVRHCLIYGNNTFLATIRDHDWKIQALTHFLTRNLR